MTPDWITEAEKAIAAATPEPWEFYDGKVFGPDRNILMTGAHMRHTDECQSCRDVKFAVVARTALPLAIKDLQEAWKANGELEAELERHATDRVNQRAELARKDAKIAEHVKRSNKNHDAALGFQDRALRAESELALIKEALWPGLPKFEPTPEKPQQDFNLAIIESFRTQYEMDKARNQALRAEVERLGKELKPYRWRPISEIHEDFGPCVLMSIDDPGHLEVGSNLDEDFNEEGFTHFAEVPKWARNAEIVKQGEE